MTTEERLAELETAVTNLEGIVNAARFMSPRMSPEDWTAAKATSYITPSGDRNIYDNLRELRIDWAGVHETIDALKEDVAALKSHTPASTSVNANIQVSYSSDEGAGIMFISDTDFSASQRKDDSGNPNHYQQVAGIGLSEDGGLRRFQNVVFPGAGKKAYIPDPTRLGVVMGFDRLGNESLTYYYAGAEMEPGKYEAKEFNIGQQMVFVRGDDGKSMSIFLPQPGGQITKSLCATKVNEVTSVTPI